MLCCLSALSLVSASQCVSALDPDACVEGASKYARYELYVRAFDVCQLSNACHLSSQSTGVEFPEVTTLWEGEKLRSMGAGVRAKKFAFVPVKVSITPPKPIITHPMSLPSPLLEYIPSLVT